MVGNFASQGTLFLQGQASLKHHPPCVYRLLRYFPNPSKHPDLLHRLYSVLPLKSLFAAARGD